MPTDAPKDEVLPREMLWALVAMPPFLSVLFWGQEAIQTLAQMLEALASIWIYTLAVGGSIHFTFVRLAPALEARRIPLALRILAHGLMIAALVAVFMIVALPLLGAISIATHVHPVSIGIRAFIICCLYVLVGTTLARFRSRAVHEALRADAHRRAALEARFAALQARTNPHFLFNTLNAVASLIAIDAERAERTLEKLASLFRYALDGAQRGSVPLRDEMDAVRDYLEIETTRFGERLKPHVDVEPRAAAVLLPPMMVQPLVENAILHGLGRGTRAGNVWVNATCEGSDLVVCVEDDGVGPGASTHTAGTRSALTGIRERLALAFGDGASLVTGERAGGGFRVVLRLPIEST